MSVTISPLAVVENGAQRGIDVEIGPFCRVGKHCRIGDGTRLDSHVVIVGNTSIGRRNHFQPHTVIGGDPQDVSYRQSDTRVEIGDDNVFREGVTVNRGAEKEDRTTRIGHGNMLMANSHVAHNCHVFNRVKLVNGVLLGGHVHVHDGAIVSGNSVVHHFSTLGTLCFVSGGCRVPHDVPPFMLAAGSDNPEIKTINAVGLKRANISADTIQRIKQVFRILFRQRKSLDEARQAVQQAEEHVPAEVAHLLDFMEQQKAGVMGRAREAQRHTIHPQEQTTPESTGKAKAA